MTRLNIQRIRNIFVRIVGALTLSAVCTLNFNGIGVAQVRSPLYELPTDSISITTIEGARCTFRTVIVREPRDRNRGLMYVRHLPVNQSMLFLHTSEQRLSMWMKNTHVPLDMWFIDASGVIKHIVRDTEPMSQNSILSSVPVLAVLELNAGLSDLLGVTVGAKVTHPVFRRPP